MLSITIISLVLLTSTSVVRERGGAADTGEHLYLATLARRSPVITHLGAGLLTPPLTWLLHTARLVVQGVPQHGRGGGGRGRAVLVIPHGAAVGNMEVTV